MRRCLSICPFVSLTLRSFFFKKYEVFKLTNNLRLLNCVGFKFSETHFLNRFFASHSQL